MRVQLVLNKCYYHISIVWEILFQRDALRLVQTARDFAIVVARLKTLLKLPAQQMMSTFNSFLKES